MMSLFDSQEGDGTQPPDPMSLQGMAPPRAPTGLFDPMPAPAPTSNIVQRVMHRLQNGLTGEAPSVYGKLLSPEDIQASQPGLFHSILSPVGAPRREFLENLNNAVSASQKPQEIAQQKTWRDIQTSLAHQFAPPTDHKETVEETRDRFLQMYVEGARLGANPAWLDKIGDVAKETAKVIKPVVTNDIEWLNTGGKLVPVRKGTLVPLSEGMPITASEDQKRQWELNHAQASALLSNSKEQAEMGRAEQESRAFNTQTKALVDRQSKYLAFKNATAQAKLQNPEAYKAVLLNFMNSESAGSPQARLGMLQFMSDIDPSVKGRMEIASARLANSVFPKHVLEGLEKVIDGSHASVAAQYEQMRAARVKNNPRLENLLPTTATQFDVPGVLNPNDAPGLAGSRVRKLP